MRKVNIQRFQKKEPEEISFQGSPVQEKPFKLEVKPFKRKRKKGEPTQEKEISERTNERTFERLNERSFYRIDIPKDRKKIRSSFDIYEDQKTALGKLQLAIMDITGNKKKPILGNIVQEALDLYIKEKAKELKNIKINEEKEEPEAQANKEANERSNERTNERSNECSFNG